MEENYMDRNTHRDVWTWPARTYACSFCKKEFKSAQALGGHMNIHRREKARLRASSLPNSSAFECPKPNPINDSNPANLLSPPPNLSDEVLNFAQPSLIYSPCDLSLSSPVPSPPGSTSDQDKVFHHFPLLSSHQSEEIMVSNNTRSGFDVGEMKGNEEEEEEHNVIKNDHEQNITLELGLGLPKQQEEKLDLELRLGYF